MMHSALVKSGIVGNIIGWCDSQTVLALGRTCRVLFETTTNSVWKNLPKVQFLQEALGSTVTRSGLTGEENSKERVTIYLNSVKSVKLDESGLNFLDRHALSLDTTFPGLTSVVLTIRSVKDAGLFSTCILPRLTQIHLQSTSAAACAAFVDLMQSIQTRPRNLDSFIFFMHRVHPADQLDEDIERATVEILRAHPELTCLNVSAEVVTRPAIYTEIEHLPNLQRINLHRIWDSGSVETDETDTKAFPTLRWLSSLTHSLEGSTKLFASMASTALEYVELRISTPSDVQPLFNLSQAIAEHAPSLHRFHLGIRFEGATTGGRVSWDDLVPLLNCKSMTHFSVRSTTIGFGDEDVSGVVDSWRGLQSFCLVEVGDGGTWPLGLARAERYMVVSREGLRQFAKGCQHLERLTVPVDLTKTLGRAAKTTVLDRSLSRVSELHVGRSPIKSPAETERFLRSLFPELRKFSRDKVYGDENATEKMVQVAHGWAMVLKALMDKFRVASP